MVLVELVKFGPTSKNLMVVIFALSTYFTSVWLWLIVLSGWCAKALSKYLGSFQFILGLVDIRNKPILSLGTIAIALITSGYLVAAPFVLM